MHGLLRALVAVQLLAPLCAIAADEKVLIELNTAEASDNHCRVSFVIENKSAAAIQSMKLDLVAFGTDGAILQRFLIEAGPLRAAKTMVRTAIFNPECRQL